MNIIKKLTGIEYRLEEWPEKRKRFNIRAMFVIRPKILYLTKINVITKIKPIIRAIIPAFIESCPRSGPTVLSSIILSGAGKAPDLSSKARSVAD